MNLPFDVSFSDPLRTADLLASDRDSATYATGAGGNDAIYNIAQSELNGGLAGAGIQIPTKGFWVMGYSIETDAPCVAQFGLLNPAGDDFIPLDTHVCTTVAGGGIVRVSGANGSSGIWVPITADSGYRFALRVTAGSECRVTGNLDLYLNEM